MYVEAYETSSSFYNSQLYKVFICDVCNRSLCVIPFDFIKPDNINILHWAKKSQHVSAEFFRHPLLCLPVRVNLCQRKLISKH